MRQSSLFIVVALLLTVPTAAQAARCVPSSVPAAAPEIRLGVALLHDEQFAAASLEVSNGYRLWETWVNTEHGGINIAGVCHRAVLIFAPDTDTLDPYVIEELIFEDGINFLFSPYAPDHAHIAAVVGERENMIVIDSGGTDSRLYERNFHNLFGLTTPVAAYTASGVEEAFRLGARTAIIAYTENTHAIAQGGRDNLDRLGMRTLAMDVMPTGTAPITSLFTRYREMRPDLFIAAGSSEDVRYWLDVARAMRLNVPAFLIAQGLTPANIGQWGAYAEYMWSAVQWQPTLRYADDYFGTASDYAARYNQTYGVEPGADAAKATASALALQLAIEAANTLDTDSIRVELLNLDLETFYGDINFDEHGLSSTATMLTAQVQMGQLIPIAPTGSDAVIWPMPAWEERTQWN